MDDVRYLCIDFTIFTIQNATGSIALDRVSYPGNSAEQLFALRKQVLYWANDTLRDAKNKVHTIDIYDLVVT